MNTNRRSDRMVVRYGLIVGIIGFLIGFIPVVFTPEASDGSLLGIFIAGPMGFALGILIGTVFKAVQKRNPEFRHPLHHFF